MPGFEFIAGDRVACPGLNCTERAPLNAWDLDVSCHRVAGHSEMMLERRLGCILDNSWTGVVSSRDEGGGHCRRNTDFCLATAFRGSERCIVLAQIADRRRCQHAVPDLLR